MSSRLFFAVALCWAGLGSGLQAQLTYDNYTFVTIAGPIESPGFRDGTGRTARFFLPFGVAADGNGNVYVVDSGNHLIRRIDAQGVVTTLAGREVMEGAQDGKGAQARFASPNGIAADASGNIYVADTYNHAIRKITPLGVVSTVAGQLGVIGIADGTGSAARFAYPTGVAVDHNGNLYVADNINNTIRKITPDGVVTTWAGTAGTGTHRNGTGNAARFYSPFGVAIDTQGNLFVADYGSHTIRKITPARVVTTVAGSPNQSGNSNGTGAGALFNRPFGVATDEEGNVYVVDINHAVRKVTTAGVVTTVAGITGVAGDRDGEAATATFNLPTGLAVDGSGNIFVAEYGNHLVRKIGVGGDVTTVAGQAGGEGTADGIGENARFRRPSGLALDPGTGDVFISDLANHAIRKLSPQGMVTTFVGLPGTSGSQTGTGNAARFNQPAGIVRDAGGNIYVADSQNHQIRKITPAGEVSVLAGGGVNGSADGTGVAASFHTPYGITLGGDGNIYVGDSLNQLVRKVTPDGVVTTIAGLAGSAGNTDGDGNAARLNFPVGIVMDSANNLYVADNGGHTIRKISPDRQVTTFAGAGGIHGAVDGDRTAARFLNPFGLALDAVGNLFQTEGQNIIRKISAAGSVSTIAGIPGAADATDGTGADALFNKPQEILIQSNGDLLVADSENHKIRRGFPALPDSPGVDLPVGQVGVTRHLTVTNLTTTVWSWTFLRYPSGSQAQLSASDIPNPTFTPDVSDLYILRFQGSDAEGRVALKTIYILGDAEGPTVAITSPTPGQRWSNAVFRATGTAHDDGGVDHVRYRLNGGEWSSATGTTNWTVQLPLVPGTNTLAVMATDVTGNDSTVATTHLFYSSTSPLVVQIEGKGSIKPNYHNQLLDVGGSYTMVATPASGSAFAQWTDETGSVVSTSPTLTFLMRPGLVLKARFTESLKPTIAITAPRANLRWNSETITVTGTARDNVALAAVWYRNNGGDWTEAASGNGFTNWSGLATLVPGVNVIRAFAVDSSGNRSTTNAVSLTYVLSDRLTLSNSGLGSLTPNYSNALLELGKSYKITAKPAAGYVFSNWTGNVTVSTPDMTFMMQSNFVLHANFVINPFVARKGSYQGLVSIPDQPALASAGHITVTLTDKGSFSGRLLLAGGTHSFTGTFGLNGLASLQILRPGKPTLVLNLTADFVGNETVTGTVSDGTFTAQVLARRGVYSTTNPAPYAGKYTIVFPATATVNGDGIGTVTVSAAGAVTLAGYLADGTAVRQSGTISSSGQWPFYVSLYQGRGVIAGWIQFQTEGVKSFAGTAQWIKTPDSALYYPGGFNDAVSVTGHSYIPPVAGASVLNFNNGTLRLQGGNLATEIAVSVTIANNTFQAAGTNALKLTLVTASGLVNGSFFHPQTRKTASFKAAVLGNNAVHGFFLGTNQAGQILIGP